MSLSLRLALMLYSERGIASIIALQHMLCSASHVLQGELRMVSLAQEEGRQATATDRPKVNHCHSYRSHTLCNQHGLGHMSSMAHICCKRVDVVLPGPA